MTDPQAAPTGVDNLTAMPLQVRWSSAVCACGCLKAEHNLAGDNRTRTGCSRAKCPALTTGGCQAYTHAVDRYAVSTYVDVPAGAPKPQMALQRVHSDTDVRRVLNDPGAYVGRRGGYGVDADEYESLASWQVHALHAAGIIP